MCVFVPNTRCICTVSVLYLLCMRVYTECLLYMHCVCVCLCCICTLCVCCICSVCVVFALCVYVVFAVCVCVCVAFAVCVCSVSQRSPHICLIPPATTLLTVAQCKFITDCKINHLGGRKYLSFVLLCFVFVFVLKLCDFERQIIFVIIALICVNSPPLLSKI